MDLLDQLKTNKETVSSALGKELAEKVLKGDNDLKVVGLAYSFNYYFWVKKKRNVIRE